METDKVVRPKNCDPSLYSNNPCKNFNEYGTSMETENYKCEVCGERLTLYYDEMR